MDAKTRRIEINQITLGTGVVWFSLWFAIRTALTLFVFSDDVEIEGGLAVKIIAYILIGIFIGTICLLHYYIGRSAKKEGRGKRKSIAYLIVTVITAIIYIVSMGYDIAILFTKADDLISTLVSTAIDVTTLICLIEIVINSIRLRKIRRTENGGVA